MTTDLPALPVRKQPYGSLGFGQKADNGGLYHTTSMTLHMTDGAGNLLPSVQTNPSKRRTSEGQVLQVKFAPDVTSDTFQMTPATPLSAPTLDRVKTVVPGFDTTFNVDHTHYEQWARVPGRRGPSSTLLRGIQALKARMKRESMEQERIEAGYSQNRELHINTLSRNSLLTRDRLTEDNQQNASSANEQKRDKIVPPSFPKAPAEPRNPLKMTTIEAEFLRHGPNGIYREERTLNAEDPKHNDTTPRDIKPRIGISKIRDRCAIPVSVYQPITIGDHVFLINEPLRYNEFIKLKSRNESRMKKDSKSAAGNKPTLKEASVEMAGKEADDRIEPLERSKTFASGFQTGKLGGKRAPVSVSNAEVFDFSQLSEIRHSMDGKMMERSKTEFTFNTSKSTRSVKLVPNVRRLKEVFKSME